MRTFSYQVLVGLAVMTTFRLTHLRAPGRDVVGKFAAVVTPQTANTRTAAVFHLVDIPHSQTNY